MTNLPNPLHRSTTLEQALSRLLEHTARRVRDGVRSAHTLQMQSVHVGWLTSLRLPAELAEQLGAATLGAVRLELLTPQLLVALVEHWRTRGGAGGRPLGLNSVAKRKCTVARALRLAVERGELGAMPQMPEIALPPLRPRMRVLRDHAQLLTLLAALPPRRAEMGVGRRLDVPAPG